MRTNTPLLPVLLLFPVGMLAATPIDNLPDFLRPVDLVIVGQLSNVEEDVRQAYPIGGGTTSLMHSGSAELKVDKVLWGSPPTNHPLALRWVFTVHAWDTDPPRMHLEGERGIYFITCPEQLPLATSSLSRCDIGDNSQVYEYFYLPSEQQKVVERLLVRHPLRMYFPDGAFTTSSNSVRTVISFLNPSAQPMSLPGLSYRDGILYYSKGVAISMYLISSDQRTVRTRPNRSRLTDHPDILVEPGEEFSLEIDLADLFDLSISGWYKVKLELIDYPPQLEYGLNVMDGEGDLK